MNIDPSVDDGRVLRVFSDGSCFGNPGPGGWSFGAFYSSSQLTESPIVLKSSPHHLDQFTTNNEMELTAALNALKWIDSDALKLLEKNKTTSSSSLILYCDSTYVVNGLTKWLNGWKGKNWKTAGGESVKNLDLWRQLDQLYSKTSLALFAKKVRFDVRWVKAHAGIHENEMVDQAAKDAAKLHKIRLLEVTGSVVTQESKKRNRNQTVDADANQIFENSSNKKTKVSCTASVQQEPSLTNTNNTTSAPVNNEEEQKYLDLVKELIDHKDDIEWQASASDERTGTGTVRTFGRMLRFNLQNHSFPLLTCRPIFWRGVVEELMWMLRGSTNSKLLSQKGVTIWNNDTSRVTLDKRGFTDYPEGMAGPIYGWQWRRFNAPYKVSGSSPMTSTTVDGSNSSSSFDAGGIDKGVDQISILIDKLRNTPFDRRLIVSAWNPLQIHQMVLPPCHYVFQCFCSRSASSGRLQLSLEVILRSSDVALGLPFNIASYALLTIILASIVDMDPYELIVVTSDTHIYKTHIEQMSNLAQRNPNPFPKLKLNKQIQSINEICSDEFRMEEYFNLENYKPHPQIKMEMTF